jgi:hypothetical protein
LLQRQCFEEWCKNTVSRERTVLSVLRYLPTYEYAHEVTLQVILEAVSKQCELRDLFNGSLKIPGVCLYNHIVVSPFFYVKIGLENS